MARQSTTITTLPRSPEDDRRARMIKYTVMMSIRVVCIGLCVVVQGWWLLLFALGAIFLPYIAVVLANAVDARVSNVERPVTMPLMISAPESESDAAADSDSDETFSP